MLRRMLLQKAHRGGTYQWNLSMDGEQRLGLTANRTLTLWKAAKACALTSPYQETAAPQGYGVEMICPSQNDLSASTTDLRPDIKCFDMGFILHFTGNTTSRTGELSAYLSKDRPSVSLTLIYLFVVEKTILMSAFIYCIANLRLRRAYLSWARPRTCKMYDTAHFYQ